MRFLLILVMKEKKNSPFLAYWLYCCGNLAVRLLQVNWGAFWSLNPWNISYILLSCLSFKSVSVFPYPLLGSGPGHISHQPPPAAASFSFCPSLSSMVHLYSSHTNHWQIVACTPHASPSFITHSHPSVIPEVLTHQELVQGLPPSWSSSLPLNSYPALDTAH